jgi:hypothetical protein
MEAGRLQPGLDQSTGSYITIRGVIPLLLANAVRNLCQRNMRDGELSTIFVCLKLSDKVAQDLTPTNCFLDLQLFCESRMPMSFSPSLVDRLQNVNI